MTKRNSNNWSVSFGKVKSVDVESGSIFKATVKANPYIRGARWQARKPINMRTMTNSEAY